MARRRSGAFPGRGRHRAAAGVRGPPGPALATPRAPWAWVLRSTVCSDPRPCPGEFRPQMRLPRTPQSPTHAPQDPDPIVRQPERAPAQDLPAHGREDQRPGAAVREALRRRVARADRTVPRTPGCRQHARRPAARGLCGGSRGRQAHAEDAPLRRAADRRYGAAPGQDRRDAHRRGQDADGDAAGVPERAVEPGCARRHRERLPRPPRRRMDGAPVQLPRPHGGRERARHGPRGEAGGLRRRRHLRHQQRVRLRLPARQHGRTDARGTVRASGT